MKGSFVILFILAAFPIWACPTPPAYYNQDVCQAVRENSTTYKTAILRIQLRAEAVERQQSMNLSDECQIKLAYTVCGNRFVGQQLAQNILYDGTKAQIQELLNKSKKYISPESDWIKKLVERKSFGLDRDEDEIKVLLYQEKLIPQDTNMLKFIDNFQDKTKIPTELYSLLQERENLEKRFWDPEYDKSLKSGMATDWAALFKKDPELLKRIQMEIYKLPADEKKFQNFRLATIQKPQEEQRLARISFLQQKLSVLPQKKGWQASDDQQFQQVLAEASPLNNSEAIGLMKMMVHGVSEKQFPETAFWKVFNEIRDESLSSQEKEDLMMILYQLDNTAWAKKALSSLASMDEFITDKIINGCEIEPEKLRAYFSDAYKKYRDKNTILIHDKLRDPSLNHTQMLVLLLKDFDPTLKVGEKNFLDLIVDLPMTNFTQDQVLDVIKVGCGKFNCVPLLKMQEPSPIGRSIETNRPMVLKAFLDYLRLRRHGYLKEDRNYLRKLNKNSSDSKEIKRVLNQAEWI